VKVKASNRVSVLISAYNNAVSLEKTLWSLEQQSDLCFDVIIADDGSRAEMKTFIDHFSETSSLKIIHVWQPDEGFRKSRILNLAIQAATCDYLIFMDGDIIVANDFIAQHKALARPNAFISGGNHINLHLTDQANITLNKSLVQSQNLLSPQWYGKRGITIPRMWRLYFKQPTLAKIVDTLMPRPDSFLGCNSACWKRDALAVGGFNENFTTYGYEDRNFGLRLATLGVKGIRYQCSLRYIHLDHSHPYADNTAIAENKNKVGMA